METWGNCILYMGYLPDVLLQMLASSYSKRPWHKGTKQTDIPNSRNRVKIIQSNANEDLANTITSCSIGSEQKSSGPATGSRAESCVCAARQPRGPPIRGCGSSPPSTVRRDR